MPIPKWQIALLIVIFFLGVWAAMLAVLTHFSKVHTWLLPVFAVGLGAPRWCQVSSTTVSKSFGRLLRRKWEDALVHISSTHPISLEQVRQNPYLGISLWLWLGVLDAIQGVGLGMILLQVISFNLPPPHS